MCVMCQQDPIALDVGYNIEGCFLHWYKSNQSCHLEYLNITYLSGPIHGVADTVI